MWWYMMEIYMIGSFAEIVNGCPLVPLKTLDILGSKGNCWLFLQKRSIVDIRQGSKYAVAYWHVEYWSYSATIKHCNHVIWTAVFVKACVRYFLRNFWFSSNDSPSKNMRCSLYHLKALFVLKIFRFFFISSFPSFFSLSAIAWELDSR